LFCFSTGGATLEGFLDRQAFRQTWNHMIEQRPEPAIFDWQPPQPNLQIVPEKNPSASVWA